MKIKSFFVQLLIDCHVGHLDNNEFQLQARCGTELVYTTDTYYQNIRLSSEWRQTEAAKAFRMSSNMSKYKNKFKF